MKNKIKLEIDKAIKMDSIDVMKADKMIDKIESKINEGSIEDLFDDLPLFKIYICLFMEYDFIR